MPKFLTKEYGPFTGGVWIVIVVGGVGLGLVMKRFMNRNTGEFSATSPASEMGTTDPASPVFAGGGTTFNQGEIVSSVVEALKAQTPPPATTTPGPAPAPSNAGLIAELQRRITGLKAEQTSLQNQYANLNTQYQNTPKSQPNKRAELYAEMEANEHKRRQNSVTIAGLQAQLAAAKR